MVDILCEILLENGSKYTAVFSDALNLKANDYCVIRKERYLDYGQVFRVFPATGAEVNAKDLPRIERKATVRDQGKANENHVRGKSALRSATQMVEKHGLDMKLLNAHYTYDGKMVTIQFTADGRIDFRELVKDLSQSLGTRIELRQIGVRDEAGICGGIGVCGRPLCCSTFLKEFASINVKMAKAQDLSLNTNTISGVCGRLKCCLKYEYETYIELDRDMPRKGDWCECEGGRGRIIDRNLLTRKVVVALEDTGKTLSCQRDEVRVVYPEKYKLPNKNGDKNDESS